MTTENTSTGAIRRLAEDVTSCRRCARLVAWREDVAKSPRATASGEAYWAKGVPSFGDANAKLLIVGLAPAAHGANRTGRMFTGDRSGDFLFAALHRHRYTNIPTSIAGNDGLTLRGAFITAAVHCAPPENKPTPTERHACATYLHNELDTLSSVEVILALGAIAFNAVLSTPAIRARCASRVRFAHGLEVPLRPADAGARWVIASYHPSQRNVFTGRLSEASFDAIFERINALGA